MLTHATQLRKEAAAVSQRLSNPSSSQPNNRPQAIAQLKMQALIQHSAKAAVQRQPLPNGARQVVQRVIDKKYLDETLKPKVDRAKERSPMNAGILDKMYRDVEEASKTANKKSILRHLTAITNFMGVINAAPVDEQAWSPTGGKIPALDARINDPQQPNHSVYLHFTNQDGFMSILQNGRIEDHSQRDRPGSQPGIYVAPGHQTFNSEEAFTNLFLGSSRYTDRGEFVFAFLLPTSSVHSGAPLTHGSPYNEARHTGDIDIRNALYGGPNPFITGHHY